MAEMTGKEKCWICRRTKEEVDEYKDKVHVEGKLQKWLCLEHIVPVDWKGENGIDIENQFVICPFCREAIHWSWIQTMGKVGIEE